ncbi:MAG: leader peptide processing enzyme [Treponema sp.]|nr:leader peptide processing enzyme [Treponema sp.]
MNKKLNTFLFILGATLFNILVVVVTWLLLMVIFVRFFLSLLPETSVNWAFSLIFIGAIVVSFIVYRLVLNKLTSKINFEDYFDPIIKSRRPPPRKRND